MHESLIASVKLVLDGTTVSMAALAQRSFHAGPRELTLVKYQLSSWERRLLQAPTSRVERILPQDANLSVPYEDLTHGDVLQSRGELPSGSRIASPGSRISAALGIPCHRNRDL